MIEKSGYLGYIIPRIGEIKVNHNLALANNNPSPQDNKSE